MTDLENLFPKVAIVADQMNGFGGADRELISMLKLFPNAELFTITFNKKIYPQITNVVHTSFLQKWLERLPKSLARHLKVFTPWAYESFNFDGFDLVISISAGPAKGIITGIDQPHIAMTMTPPRSLWDKESNFRALKLSKMYSAISETINVFMRIWDINIAKRVDYWTANSKYIQKKIKRTYGVDATVIYPGIEERYFETKKHSQLNEVKEKYSLPEDFVLIVSRLYDYKRIDWAIRACIETNKKLVIVGEGPDRKYLEKVANKNPNITFLGYVSDDEAISLFRLASLLLFCGLEDFGIVPVEAMAAGTPVFALREGGLLETVKEHITGEFFKTEEELCNLLKDFDKRRYNGETIVKQARNFTEAKFLNNLEKYITQIYEKETKK
ncbi:glycosyltransferase [Patescibacteria group bacterium]|nr:glycosyltransferase [Patescibacteria group bacterium]